MDTSVLFKALEDPIFGSILLGFFTCSLFVVWRKAAARWVNWFPLLAKGARLFLYLAAALVAFQAVQVFSSSWFTRMHAGLILGGALAPAVFNKLSRMLRRKETLRRGAAVDVPAVVNRQTAKLPKEEFNDNLVLGGVNIPRSAEPYHFFVVGSTGSGKSVAITQVLDDIEARGDIALVVDSGGEFCSRFYKPGRDAILNPFDDRCVPWSPTAEMAGPWDAESLAKSMIPDGVGESKEWNGYAQMFVTSILRKLDARNQRSIKNLLYYVQAAPLEELTPLLAGTAAAAQLVSDKTFGSIRTIAANYLATYAYLTDNTNPFSVSKFIQAEKPGFLFMTYRDDQLDSLRNMISCALDIAARTILAMPASSTRRVWLVIDEFASIGKVQSIEAMATKSRKMGGCLLLGLQSVSQLKERYGDNGAQTILSCLSSWLVLRCSDADTSEYVSKYIGDAEISRMTRSESASETGGGSDSLNEQIQTQRAVMPVQLQRLKNLEGFFKLAGDYPICNVKLKFPKKRPKMAENYDRRDFTQKPMLELIDASASAPAGSSGAGNGMTQPEGQAPVAGQAPQATLPPTASMAGVPAGQVSGGGLGKLHIVMTQFDAGPVELESALNDLAEAGENVM